MFWKKRPTNEKLNDRVAQLERDFINLDLKVENNTIRLKRKFGLTKPAEETETTKYNDGLDEVRRLNRDTPNN